MMNEETMQVLAFASVHMKEVQRELMPVLQNAYNAMGDTIDALVHAAGLYGGTRNDRAADKLEDEIYEGLDGVAGELAEVANSLPLRRLRELVEAVNRKVADAAEDYEGDWEHDFGLAVADAEATIKEGV